MTATNATTKTDKAKHYQIAQTYYWQSRVSYLRVGLDQPKDWGDFEVAYPCPPELLPIYEILTQKAPDNDLGKKGGQKPPISSDNFTRGKSEDPQGTLEEITPSKKSRRRNGQGSGYLFNKPISRNGKAYPQWWFQYEETLKDGNRKKKTVYVPKVNLDMIAQLNQGKAPVDKILEALGRKANP